MKINKDHKAKFFDHGFFLLFLFLHGITLSFGSECIPRKFRSSSFVCVCNSTYCDTVEPISSDTLQPGSFVVITTSKDKFRFARSEIQSIRTEEISLENAMKPTIHREVQYQKIIGFGGAFTDATGDNILKHPANLQKTVIEQYFGKSGLEYNIGRVPMAGTDFSIRPYTYNDHENDIALSSFSLQEEDFNLKIPLIKEAYKLQPNLKLMAAPWSAPTWMKTNGNFTGWSRLKEEYYDAWANYFLRFLEEYGKQNLTFWAISTQNEPLHGVIFNMGFNCMGWTAPQQKEWIKNHFGPKLANSEFKDVKVIMYDDQRLHLRQYTNEILGDPEAAKYISGIGLHFYTDAFIPPSILTETHNKFPEYFMLYTEACAGAMPLPIPDVILGSWERAVNYASDIINNLNNFVNGWVDWNLLLDMEGGPNWAKNFVDATMISDPSQDEIYKQPTFYALGHFSKFLPEDSVRIQHLRDETVFKGIELVTFLRPDGLVTVVLLNRLNRPRNVTLTDVSVSETGFIQLELEPKSVSTVVYHPTTPVNPTPSGTSHLSITMFCTLSYAVFCLLLSKTF